MLATSGTAEAGLIAAVEPRTDFSAAPSPSVIEYPGTFGVPPPKLKSGGRSPGAWAALFATMTDSAPPAAPLETLMLMAQTPRSTSSTLPASEPAANAAQPFLLPPAPSPY